MGDGKVLVEIDGVEGGVWVLKCEVEMEGGEGGGMVSEWGEEMKDGMKKGFKVMKMMSKGMMDGKIGWVMMCGGGGIGKRYCLDKGLENGEENESMEYK